LTGALVPRCVAFISRVLLLVFCDELSTEYLKT